MLRCGKYLILFLLLCSSACHRRKSEKMVPQQIPIAMSQQISYQRLDQGLRDTLRFGRMHQGEIVAKNIAIKNCDSRPMVILNYTTTCGCVSVKYDRKPIAPDSTSIIALEFDSRSLEGWQMKLMEFYFAEKDTPLKIFIEAEVE